MTFVPWVKTQFKILCVWSLCLKANILFLGPPMDHRTTQSTPGALMDTYSLRSTQHGLHWVCSLPALSHFNSGCLWMTFKCHVSLERISEFTWQLPLCFHKKFPQCSSRLCINKRPELWMGFKSSPDSRRTAGISPGICLPPLTNLSVKNGWLSLKFPYYTHCQTLIYHPKFLWGSWYLAGGIGYHRGQFRTLMVPDV